MNGSGPSETCNSLQARLPQSDKLMIDVNDKTIYQHLNMTTSCQVLPLLFNPNTEEQHM